MARTVEKPGTGSLRPAGPHSKRLAHHVLLSLPMPGATLLSGNVLNRMGQTVSFSLFFTTLVLSYFVYVPPFVSLSACVSVHLSVSLCVNDLYTLKR